MIFSVVVPLYKCSKSVTELTERLVKVLEKLSPDFEIIYVNDASPENDWEVVSAIAKTDKRIKGINLSRNFGQHYAITAGLDYSTGNWVVVMDGDLQDRPEEIVNLYSKAQEGFDIVLAQRKTRQDSFIKKTGSYLFYKIFGYLTDTVQDNTVANFGIYQKKVIGSILLMHDSIKYFPTMVQWVGFNKTYLPVVHSMRAEGGSAYNMRRLLSLAFDNIIAFSNKPLKLMVKFGFFIVAISIFIAIYYLAQYFTGNIEVVGFPSLIISIWFLSGINMMILGVVGIYVGKTFESTKNRPLYIVKDQINT